MDQQETRIQLCRKCAKFEYPRKFSAQLYNKYYLFYNQKENVLNISSEDNFRDQKTSRNCYLDLGVPPPGGYSFPLDPREILTVRK